MDNTLCCNYFTNDNDICVINTKNVSNNEIDSSISLTFSESNDEQMQSKNELRRSDLEISYKSVFFSDKKCNGTVEQKGNIKQIEYDNWFENENKTTKNTATTNERNVNNNNNTNNIKATSLIQAICNDSIDNVNQYEEGNLRYDDLIIQSNKEEIISSNNNNECFHIEEHPHFKRSKSLIYEPNTTTVQKGNSMINKVPSSTTCLKTRMQNNPFINNNNNNKTIRKSKSHANKLITNILTPRSIHNNNNHNNTKSINNKALKTYLQRIASPSNLNTKSHPYKQTLKHSYSHRDNSSSAFTLFKHNSTQKTSQLKHKSPLSPTSIDNKHKKGIKSSKSTCSFFHSSSFITKETPNNNNNRKSSNNRKYIYHNFNSPNNNTNKQTDSRNPILKQSFLNLKSKHSPKINNLYEFLGNSMLSQRNNNHIHMKSSFNLLSSNNNIKKVNHCKKDYNKTMLSKIQHQTKYNNTNNNVKYIYKKSSTVNNKKANNNCLNLTKQIYTINNFSKYIKTSRKT